MTTRRRRFRRHIDTVAGQVIALMVVAIILTHLIISAVFYLERADLRYPPAETFGRIAAIVHLVEGLPKDEAATLITKAAAVEGDLMLALVDERPENSRLMVGDPIRRDIGMDFAIYETRVPQTWHGYLDFIVGSLHAPEDLYIKIDSGFLRARYQGNDRLPLLGPTSITAITIVIGVAFLGVWAALALTAPLRHFAHAVDRFGDGATPTVLAENGPAELRTAIAAFNRMQAKVAKLVEDRMKMLAAVSHDLKTPITRLRLRAETVEEEQTRDAMILELDRMARLVNDSLTYLRGSQIVLLKEPTDLPSLLETISDNFADLGHKVPYQGPTRFDIAVNADDISRAVTNLVENAVRHSNDVVIKLDVTPSHIHLSVCDHGPGISASQREAMMEPFVRGVDARTVEDEAHFGLGLSIAKAIALAHDGRLVLADNTPTGLIARLELPRA